MYFWFVYLQKKSPSPPASPRPLLIDEKPQIKEEEESNPRIPVNGTIPTTRPHRPHSRDRFSDVSKIVFFCVYHQHRSISPSVCLLSVCLFFSNSFWSCCRYDKMIFIYIAGFSQRINIWTLILEHRWSLIFKMI